MDYNRPYMIERIVATLSYLSMGVVGFIWLILGLFTKASLRPFMQYHIFQSIFISIALYLIETLLRIIVGILVHIPVIGKIVMNLIVFLNSPILLDYSLIQVIFVGLLAYLMLTSFLGMYSYLPFISDIIRQNVRR